MLGFSFGVACGAKRFEYFMSKISVFMFLMSWDVENQLRGVKMIQIDIFNVFGR